MSDEAMFPIMGELPESNGEIPNVTVQSCEHEAKGVLVAQDAEDLFEITIQMFMSEDPSGCTTVLRLNAAGAREVAEHLLHLAQYAEQGVESSPQH